MIARFWHWLHRARYDPERDPLVTMLNDHRDAANAEVARLRRLQSVEDGYFPPSHGGRR